MDTLIAYLAAGVTAAAVALFVFLLFPKRAAATETDEVVEVHPTVGVVQQSTLGRRDRKSVV